MKRSVIQEEVAKVVLDEAGREIEAIDAQLDVLNQKKKEIKDKLYSTFSSTAPDLRSVNHFQGTDYMLSLKDNVKYEFDLDGFNEMLTTPAWQNAPAVVKDMVSDLLHSRHRIDVRAHRKAADKLSIREYDTFIRPFCKQEKASPTISISKKKEGK